MKSTMCRSGRKPGGYIDPSCLACMAGREGGRRIADTKWRSAYEVEVMFEDGHGPEVWVMQPGGWALQVRP